MSEAFLPNATIDGRFRIRSVIGAGTFGMVYAADDLRDGGLVALKTLHEKVKLQDEYVLRFEREADVTRKLSHPSITRLVTAGHLDEEGGVTTPYLAFELIRGLPLSRLLEARGPLSAREAVHLTATLLSALSAAHQQGILHRDLKPDNILVAAPDNLITEPQAGGSLSMRLGIPEPDHENWSDLRSHTVKVLDFGLAKILDIGQGRVKALTKAGFAPGTAHYMSPEQVRGTSDLDYRADLYAVGLPSTGCSPAARPSPATTPWRSSASSSARPPPRSHRRTQTSSTGSSSGPPPRTRQTASPPQTRWPGP